MPRIERLRSPAAGERRNHLNRFPAPAQSDAVQYLGLHTTPIPSKRTRGPYRMSRRFGSRPECVRLDERRARLSATHPTGGAVGQNASCCGLCAYWAASCLVRPIAQRLPCYITNTSAAVGLGMSFRHQQRRIARRQLEDVADLPFGQVNADWLIRLTNGRQSVAARGVLVWSWAID